MKKCPYCAEDIQDEARKCRHCGEWLACAQDGELLNIQSASAEGDSNSEIKTTATEPQEKVEVLDDQDPSKYREIPGAKNLVKKPGKFGWGWLIILAMFTNYSARNDPFSDFALSFFWNALVFVFLILYFWLRRTFIVKWSYDRWTPGFVAGICTLIVAIIIHGSMMYFDTKSFNTAIASVAVKYRGRMESFTQEDGKYQAKLIAEPQTIADIKQNVKAIDEILEYLSAKQKIFSSMCNDYKIALKDKRNTESKKPWSDEIDNILSLSDEGFLRQKRAFELLRDYYVSGNEKSYQEYTAVYAESERLANEFQKLVKELFHLQ